MKSADNDLPLIKPKLPSRFFYGIGAHKAGTTWVHSVLQDHPDVFLPYFKEVLYFSSVNLAPWLLNPVSRFFIRLKNVFLPAGAQNWLLNRHKIFKNRVHNHLWRRCLLAGKRNDHWYLSLFHGQDEKVLCGEISPEYAILGEDDIARMAVLAPQAKVLFIMRDPVQRVWSNYRFMKLRARNNQDVDVHRVKAYIESPATRARTDYYGTMLCYEKFFPRENIKYMFYEDMADNPRAFMQDLCGFLALDFDKIPDHVFARKVNVSKVADIPPDLESDLYKTYEAMIQRVEVHVGHVPDQWKRTI